MRKAYAAYQERCERAGLVDFAELLLRAHELWGRNPDLLAVYRQRFRPVCGANTADKMYRLLRACRAYTEQWREPFTGAVECDETTCRR